MAGKAACKAALQEELGLACEADTPLIAMVTRLVGHKGLDLVQEAMDGIMATGCQFVVLGTGEWRYEDFFRQKSWQYGGRLSAQLTYSEGPVPAHLRRRRPVPHALPQRFLRPEPDDRHALRRSAHRPPYRVGWRTR